MYIEIEHRTMEHIKNYELHEQDGYDPLHDLSRETGFADPFFDFPVERIEDLEHVPFPPPDLY